MADASRNPFPTRIALVVGSVALVVAIVVGMVAGANFGSEEAPTDAAAAEGSFVAREGSGKRAPDFDLAAFDGEGRVTSADFEGKPLVLNFWASWCPFCIEEMPDFERVHQRYRDVVAFLGVDLQDDPGLARTLVERTGVTYALAVDDGEAFRAFEGRAMPTTVLITADGHIATAFGGRSYSADELEAQILEHLIDPA